MVVLPPDPYKILGVSKDAQLPEIRSAHRKLVLKCHPDKVQDLQLKEQKQIEFQRVQQAYELLSNEVERTRYDDNIKLNDLRDHLSRMKASTSPPSAARTPPRPGATAYYDVQEATPRSTTFGKSSPYGRTPPRSWEDDLGSARFEDVRQARKAASYERYTDKSSKRDDSRRRRKEEEEYARAKERQREREQRERDREREERAIRKEKEKRREEREERERRQKKMEKERARTSEDKRRHKQQPPYVEGYPDEHEEAMYTSASKSDKKKSSSSRKHEEPAREGNRPSTTDRERKHSATLEYAKSYLQRSGGVAPPGLTRAHTYHDEASFKHSTPIAVPTPPPAPSAYPPPPRVDAEDITVEEDLARRSSANPRRMSNDVPRSSKDKPLYKKTGLSRESNPVMDDAPSPHARMPPSLSKSHSTPITMPTTIPPLGRSQTDQVSRPPPPPLNRAETWFPTTDREREQSRSRQPRVYSEDETEDDREYYSRRKTRRNESIEPHAKTQRYVVASGKAVRQGYSDDTTRLHKHKAAHANTSARVDRHYDGDYYEEEPAFFASKIKYADQFDQHDVKYTPVPHSHYRGAQVA